MEEQEKVERGKPYTTAKIYRYWVLNTSVYGVGWEYGEKFEGGGIEDRKRSED